MRQLFLKKDLSPLLLGARIASGGQGSVYEVKGDTHLLAKLFHAPARRDSDQGKKLATLLKKRPKGIDACAAWPIDAVLDIDGGYAGFVMTKAQHGLEINALANPASRLRLFPTCDYGFLVNAAQNLALAVKNIHVCRCVIGDINDRNVLVLPNGTVRLIDVDSFQVKTGLFQCFPCPVGSDYFTPPELRGRVLAKEHRHPNHDAFGLAILIFQLLMMGRSPFAGAMGGCDYAYRKGATQPTGTLSTSALGALAPLFEQAFTSPKRPTAAQWVAALGSFKQHLKPCPKNPRHTHLAHIPACPLCALRFDLMPASLRPDYLRRLSPHRQIHAHPARGLRAIQVKAPDGTYWPSQPYAWNRALATDAYWGMAGFAL